MTDAFEQRRRAEARRRATRRTAWLALLAGPPGLLAAVAFSPVADVDTVEVSGTRRLPVAAVRDAADADGRALVTVDTEAVRARVGALPGVKSATVSKRWPGGVRIAVVERVPVVAVPRTGSVDLYDADAVLVETLPAAPKGTPLLAVPRGDPSREVVRAAVALLRALPPQVRRHVRGLRAEGADSLAFDFADGSVVLWGDGERTPEKVRALQLLLPRHARRYDLRVPDRPTVVPR